MTNPVFFVSPATLLQGQVRIDGDEGRHAATVKRIRIGEIIDVGDGQGRRATAAVTHVGKDFVDVEIEHISIEVPLEPRIIAVQALAKGERAELAIEIATEVGADEIIPWKAEHSIAKWDSSGKTLNKWQRIAREASKQSRRSFIPAIGEAVSTSELINALKQCDVVYVLHESAESSLADVSVPARGSIAVITGPEGGISPAELAQFAKAGFVVARMGNTVMRTSTAGAIAIGALAAKTSRWN